MSLETACYLSIGEGRLLLALLPVYSILAGLETLEEGHYLCPGTIIASFICWTLGITFSIKVNHHTTSMITSLCPVSCVFSLRPIQAQLLWGIQFFFLLLLISHQEQLLLSWSSDERSSSDSEKSVKHLSIDSIDITECYIYYRNRSIPVLWHSLDYFSRLSIKHILDTLNVGT